MTTPTNNNTIEIDPLTEAMSVLDSLGGGADDIVIGGGDDDDMLAFDFAIDSDDDENENETSNNGHQEVVNTNDNTVGEESDRNISDFSFGDLDDDTLNLEDIDVDGGIKQQQEQQHTSTTPSSSDELDKDLYRGKPLLMEDNVTLDTDVHHGTPVGVGVGDAAALMNNNDNNLQGNNVGASSPAIGGESHGSNMNDNNDGHQSTQDNNWHPLQDIPTTAQPTIKATTSENFTTNNTPAKSDFSGSWTSTLSSFATKATAAVQSAVENVERAADAGPRGPYAAKQQQLNNVQGAAVPQRGVANQQAGGIVATGLQQQGGEVQQQQQQSNMSYQERQKLLHEQYHAVNNNNHTIQQQQQLPSFQPMPTPPGSNRVTPAPSPTPSVPSSPIKTTAGQTPLTPAAAATTATTATTSTTAAKAQQPSTFAEKLATSLNSTTKQSLLKSATGTLLPGEKIIMFMNNLMDVKDSSFGHVFVGSEDVLRKRGMSDCFLNGSGGVLLKNNNHNNAESAGNGEDDGYNSEAKEEKVVVTTVWACAMTFYRVIVFSYLATADGKVLLDDDDTDGSSGAEEGVTTSNGNSKQKDKSDDNEIIQQWIHSQNVSIQFQAAHCPPPTSDILQSESPSSNQKHYVFQMPLASIGRMEKTLASSQRSMGAGGTSSIMASSTSYSTGYIQPSSSTLSSASSAMVSLGSQMKPLLGGMTSGTSTVGSNLLTNGSGANLTGTINANGGGTSSTSPSSSGPLGIILHGKDGGRWIQFSTSSYSDAQRAHEALNTYAFPGRRNLGYLFAFESRRREVMASQAGQQQQPPSAMDGGNPIATAAAPTRRRFVPMEEYQRQGIFSSHGIPNNTADGSSLTMPYTSPWAPILHANANYGLCATYPSVLVGPRSIVGNETLPDGPNGSSHHGGASSSSTSPTSSSENIGLLRRCAAFRSENRFPALTWGNSTHGGSIWRSSQPKVGLQGNRSLEDERYLNAIGEEAKRANLAADARNEGGVGSGTTPRGKPPMEFLRMLCGRNNESDLIIEGGGNSSCMLKIMDMRPKSAAMGNRTQGYGYENTNNYRGSTINFYGIGNIHAVRDAYQKVNALCLNPNTSDLQWMQLVENTNWPSMIRLILSAAWQTAFHVHYNRFPVLVHCSHGWDRTSQVPALAQLLLDPYYRTREGFSTLVEKDFLSFGHPLHTRCGHGEGKNEQGGDEGQLSPIFLQFLDCTFQLVNQFPDYFEFNTRYLLLLSEHIYSCRFGTLLCDSEREREVVAGTRQRTYCMWEYLDSVPELVNPMFYDKEASIRTGALIMPLPMLLRNVTIWTDRYCMYGSKATLPCVPPSLGHAYPPLYLTRYPTEQPLVLHTTRNGIEGMLSRALEDADMWKSAALSALKEVSEMKKKHGVEDTDDT